MNAWRGAAAQNGVRTPAVPPPVASTAAACSRATCCLSSHHLQLHRLRGTTARGNCVGLGAFLDAKTSSGGISFLFRRLFPRLFWAPGAGTAVARARAEMLLSTAPSPFPQRIARSRRRESVRSDGDELVNTSRRRRAQHSKQINPPLPPPRAPPPPPLPLLPPPPSPPLACAPSASPLLPSATPPPPASSRPTPA